MRVPVSWLRELVPVETEAGGAAIAARLVAVGLEEEELFGAQLTGPLVVGRVRAVERETHRNGKSIAWCLVDIGPDGPSQGQGIVCGAPNVEADQLVAVALPGAVLPGGFAISARQTYGHLSAGMICSAAELALADDPRADDAGIMDLQQWFAESPRQLEELTPGVDLITALGLDREVVEVNVTPDRGYCLSMRGIAREYALATGSRFHDPAGTHPSDESAALALASRNAGPEPGSATADARFPVAIEDAAPIDGRPGADRYLARIVRAVNPNASTPAWMATYLREAGMRSISLPVDISNYVMLLLGQPTHAFDLASLRDGIVVRRALAGERLTTLDGVERKLHPQDLLITDGAGAVLGIAGVMGGQQSEVSETTTDLLIESAHFDPVTIARSARRHKLVTEASKRFERGVDPAIAARAAQLVVDLLVEYGGGKPANAVTDLGCPARPAAILFDARLASQLVGLDYPTREVVDSLRAIGCEVDADHEALQVHPPTWRPDLRNGPDLIEEVARVRGYDAIPSLLPRSTGGRGLTLGQRVRRAVAANLAADGLTEVLSYPFVPADLFDKLGYAVDDPRRLALSVLNPVQDDAPLLRTSLLDTLLETLRRNVARGNKDLAIFELGMVTRGSERPRRAPTPPLAGKPHEDVLGQILDAVPAQPRHVALAACGEVELAGPAGPARRVDAADAVAWVLDLGAALGLRMQLAPSTLEPWHPGRCVRVIVTQSDGAHVVGHVGELHPKVVTALGLPPRTVAAELDVDVLVQACGDPVVARALSTHPAALTDVAVVVSGQVAAGDVERALRAGAGQLLESIRLFDRYAGDQLAAGEISLAYRLSFRAPDRTLTTDEVSALRDAAVAAAYATTGARLRS